MTAAFGLQWLLAFLLSWIASLSLFFIFPGFLRRPLPSAARNGGVNNVLLVVAHPDDESIFFGPTLLSLAALKMYNIRVLCLSTGNADGLGEIRKAEMLRACAVLSISAANVHILDHPNLQDGFQQTWKLQDIVKIVRHEVQNHKISCILTFDKRGVSGHPNHIAVSHAVRTFAVEDKVREHGQPSARHQRVEVWELVSKNIFRKYSGPIEVVLSFIQRFWYPQQRLHFFVSPSIWTSTEAMQQHRSQWVWFRRLFVVFAAYTYVNTLRRV